MHDQTQQIAAWVLTHGLAHVQAEAVIDDVDVFVRITLYGQATQYQKAFAVFQFFRMRS